MPSSLSRREFLGAAAAGLSVVSAPQDPAPARWDLVIRGGEVIDPSQQLRARRDIAIHRGLVAAVAPSIPAGAAVRTISAAGLMVMPGLVDIHAHVYDRAAAFGLSADTLAPLAGTTTFVDAGTAGANTFQGLRDWIIRAARSRVLAFVNLSRIGLAGMPVGELLNLNYADVAAAAVVVASHRDVVLGVKVRQGRVMVGDNGLEPLRRAIAAAERAGTGARVMCHIGDVPASLTELLDMLRPGDILTHAYSGAGNNTVQNGRLLPAALAAKARGVLIDVGHGGASFDYTIAEPAIEQGLVPDTIGADLHSDSIKTRGKPYLPWVMSKMMRLGLTLDQVVAMTTINPARIIGRVPKLGTLQVGAPGDVTIMRMVDTPIAIEDAAGHSRMGQGYLCPVETIRGGRSLGRRAPASFPYP
jgi:dihydroorotase